jgi:hypothetical protein
MIFSEVSGVRFVAITGPTIFRDIGCMGSTVNPE